MCYHGYVCVAKMLNVLPRFAKKLYVFVLCFRLGSEPASHHTREGYQACGQ